VITQTFGNLATETLYTRTRLGLNPAELATATGPATSGEVEDNVLGTLSLGNRVWADTDNDGTINGAEAGIAAVTLELYVADAQGNPTGPAVQTDTTDGNGYYRFDNLAPGDYVVVIPASNFSGGPLATLYSSGTSTSTFNGVDPDSNATDSDDNGYNAINPVLTGVRSPAVTLAPATEPGGTDLGPGDVNNTGSNLTVDFGFNPQVPPAIRLAYVKGWSLNGRVTVEWETISEVNTAGFDLYRISADGVRVLVNSDLIPARNAYRGGVYRILDDDLPIPSRQRYELVELETTGVVNTYGPFEVEVRAAAATKGVRITGDGVEVGFTGQPGAEYEVELTDDLQNGRWETAGRVRADETGLILYRDALKSTMRFYRALQR
jgi:hypothetical protein